MFFKFIGTHFLINLSPSLIFLSFMPNFSHFICHSLSLSLSRTLPLSPFIHSLAIALSDSICSFILKQNLTFTSVCKYFSHKNLHFNWKKICQSRYLLNCGTRNTKRVNGEEIDLNRKEIEIFILLLNFLFFPSDSPSLCCLERIWGVFECTNSTWSWCDSPRCKAWESLFKCLAQKLRRVEICVIS